MGYSYSSLKELSLGTLADCINQAFSDYELPTHVDESKLLTMFQSSCVRLDLSIGAFNEKDELCGVMINAIGEYSGNSTAFDVITGVVPGERGKGVFHGMYSVMKSELKKAGIPRYTLEVLKTNHDAFRLYSSLGMDVSRSFSVLIKSTDTPPGDTVGINTACLSDVDIKNIILPGSRVPSYENTPVRVANAATLIDIAFTGSISAPDAFVLSRNDTGYIAHADCTAGKEDDLKRVIAFVSSKFKKIMVKNIDEDDSVLNGIYTSLGYAQYTSQYEMTASL